jgi:hypothetical protein
MSQENKPEEQPAAPQSKEAEPSPTVSHHEPSTETKLVAEGKATDEHGHAVDASAHAHAADDHGHGHATLDADFGEVIPEKNWQDTFLGVIAALALCGLLFVGLTWFKIEPPKEGAGAEAAPHAAVPKSD